MKVIIFGATGKLGRAITQNALDNGHEVTAFSRSASTLEIDHPRLHKVDGDVLSLRSVEQAISGQDAVIYAVGAGMAGNVRAPGTQVVVNAMRANNVQRLIALSTLGTGDTWKHLDFKWKYLMFGFLLRRAFKDHVRQEAIISESQLNWTIIRPSAFTDETLEEQLFTGTLPDSQPLKLQVPVPSLADFMVSQVDDVTYLKAAPVISC